MGRKRGEEEEGKEARTLELNNSLDKNPKERFFYNSQLHNAMNSPRSPDEMGFLGRKKEINKNKEVKSRNLLVVFSATCISGRFAAAASSTTSSNIHELCLCAPSGYDVRRLD